MTQTATHHTTHTTLVLSLEQFTKSLQGSKSNLTIQPYRSDITQFLTWLTDTDYTVTSIEHSNRGHIEEYFAFLAD